MDTHKHIEEFWKQESEILWKSVTIVIKHFDAVDTLVLILME